MTLSLHRTGRVLGGPVDDLVRPQLGFQVSLRAVGLFMAGMVAVSGHVGTGLDLLGPLAVLPTLALVLTLACFVLLLPASGWGLRSMVAVLVTLVVTAPGFLLAGDHEYAVDKVTGLVTIVLPLMVVVTYFTRGPSDLEAFWLGVYVLAALGVGVAVFEIVSGVDIGMRGADTGASLNPIAAGRLGGTVILITFLGRVRFVPRPVQYVLAGLGAWVLLGAASRGPLLALIIAGIAAGWGYRALRGRMALAAAAVSLAVIGGVGNLVLSESGERLLSDTGEAGATGRTALWETAVSAMKIWPEGVGWGNYASEGTVGAVAQYPHNFFLELGVEAGVVAALCCALFVAVVFRRLWGNMRLIGPLYFALFVFWFVTAQFSSDMNGNRVFIVALFGLYAALRSQTTGVPDLEADQERDRSGDPGATATIAEQTDRHAGSDAPPALTGAHFREEFDGRS